MRLASLRSWLGSVLRRSRMERDMDAELGFHLDARTDDLAATGLSREEARRRAEREFGDALRWKEAGREARGVAALDGLQNDIRYGWRMIGRSRAFAASAAISMAIGIGASTAIFSLVNTVLLQPLPVRDPASLVLLAVSSDDSGLGSSFPYPFYRLLRESGGVLSGVLAAASMSPTLEADGPAERVNGELVSGNYFDVLGVAPHLGRLFTEDDERAGAAGVVVLDFHYWQRRFGADPSAIGRAIRLNGEAMTIVGVTPPSFRGIEPGGLPNLRVPIVWQAAMHGGTSRLENPGEWWLQIMGRARPGVTREQAASAIGALYGGFRAQFPNQQAPPERLVVLDGSGGRPTLRRQFRAPLLILSTLVAVVLALVCVNVGSVMLARATARQREMSVRLALGAGRGRIVRQLLVEALLLAVAGGAFGLLLSAWAVRGLAALAGAPAMEIPTDLRVLAFATLATFLAGTLCGLAPAWSSARANLLEPLKTGAPSLAGVRATGRSILVAGQIALSLALLIGAGLFARTLFNLRHAGFGFDAAPLALASMNPALVGYNGDRVRLFYDEVLARVAALPSVETAAFAVMPLLAGDLWGSGLTLDTGEKDDRPGPTRNAVGPAFFRTTGIALREGRAFSSNDTAGSQPVAIVNEAFVGRYLGPGSPLGRRIGVGGPQGTARYTIVGVTRDNKTATVREDAAPFWYVPYAQLPRADQLTLHVRARGSPEAALTDVRNAIASVDPRVPIFEAATMRQQIEDQVLAERLLASLAGVFAVLAVLLASLGLYGVLSYTTAARTREIGLRMALGASPRSILGLVLSQSVRVIAAGAAVGLAITALAMQRLGPLLYELDPFDPLTLAGAVALVVAVTTAAALVPARRAAALNPAATLQ